MFHKLKNEIISVDFYLASEDFKRLWGDVFEIDKTLAKEFSNKFFKELDLNTLKFLRKLSQKF